MVFKGQHVVFKQEWSDDGDAEIEFRAIEDEDGGRVKIQANIGLTLNPVYIVTTDMLCAS